MKIEIACFNLESAMIADTAKVDRIELCDGFEFGGTTPAVDVVRIAREKISTTLYVMIRPRGGKFCYSDAEFTQMKSEIEMLKEYVDGFVFGILNPDATVDVIRNKTLVYLASPLPSTFHRAFDQVTDVDSALEEVITCGFSTILTSGTKANVTEGADILRELVLKAANRIAIMPGGGLRSSNLAALHKKVNAEFYHSSAITTSLPVADALEILALQQAI